MGKLHDVVFINKRGILQFVYTTILCCLSVFFTVPTQNDDALKNYRPVKNVP